jgi:hypothetical protein
MRSNSPSKDKVHDTEGPTERGYGAWKRAKVERGLKQSEDRDAMIPVEQVWRDLNLER